MTSPVETHFSGPSRMSTPGKRAKGKDGFLDGDVLQVAWIGLLAVSGDRRIELLTRHDAGCDLGNRCADGLGDEGHGTRRARVDFQNVDGAVLDGVLYVHQAADLQRLGKRCRLTFQFIQRFGRERACRQRAGGVARVDAGFLDMLHDAGNEDAFAVAQRIHIHFDSIGQIAIEKQRVLAEQRVDLAGLVVRVALLDVFRHEAWNGIEQIGLQLAFRMDDLHGAATQNVGWANDQREADFGGDEASLFDRVGDAVVRLRQIELHQQLLEAVAVFGKVDHVWRGAEDRNAVLFQRFGKLQRCLATELHDDADQFTLFLFRAHDLDHVFSGQRLENRGGRRCRSRWKTVSGLQLIMIASKPASFSAKAAWQQQ